MSEKKLATYAIMLFFIWLIFSGMGDFTILALGILSIILVLCISKKAFQISNFGLFNQVDNAKLLLFLPKIFIEMVKSNIYIAYLIINKKISPQIITIQNSTKTELGEYILAMSLTLTPGSLIVEYNKSEILIHVLDNKIRKSVLSLYIGKMVEKIELKDIKEEDVL